MSDVIIALIGSGLLSAVVSGGVTIATKLIDKKSEKKIDLSNQIDGVQKGIGELKDEVEDLKDEVDKIKKESRETDAVNIRYRLLRFADEVRHGVTHSEEHFMQIQSDITAYETYCRLNPDFPNEVATSSIALIRKAYQTCVEMNNFL